MLLISQTAITESYPPEFIVILRHILA